MVKQAGLGLALLALCAGASAVRPESPYKQTIAGWAEFWHSVKVDPAPPPDFLEGPAYGGRILNLTEGHLSDDAVRAWVLADRRRGRGDRYATFNLRGDITDADIFGPPGLSGSKGDIQAWRAQGVVRITGDDGADDLVMAVIWISPAQRRDAPLVQLTEYVVVRAYRVRDAHRQKVFGDGHTEPLTTMRKPGEVRWQLDTGHFYNHPVLGPLWYQQLGFSCRPNDGTVTGELCGRVTL